MGGTGYNQTAINTSPIGGQISTYAALGLNIAAILAAALGKRRKRHVTGFEHSHPHPEPTEQIMHEVLYKVVNDLDDPSCLALALCHAISLPQQLTTPAHRSLINMLTTHDPTPFRWSDVNKPATKYQYAALIGVWTRVTNAKDQCRQVFPSCFLSPDEVIKALADKKITCVENYENENV